MAVGRTNEARTVTVTTNSTTALTAAAGTFQEEDAGRAITGTGIPAGATIASVASDTAATLSAAATASGSPSVVLGRALPQAYGFTGWSPETDAESETYTVAAANAGTATPDRLTNTFTRVEQRARG
ncbi:MULTISPECIES: hypothetical protein [unclassified Streptomyces]|uniref:hypothetical protein n=1 Tax=unclassified Streptomyces TaxID=2593676 RepID=UPI000DDB4930|nr:MULTISPECIES: hypothetical protein [unclassified Streptomyces]QZZ26526.1 hypothetical protein A7X85_09900 [Streptomyces sp. ST1015]